MLDCVRPCVRVEITSQGVIQNSSAYLRARAAGVVSLGGSLGGAGCVIAVAGFNVEVLGRSCFIGSWNSGGKHPKASSWPRTSQRSKPSGLSRK